MNERTIIPLLICCVYPIVAPLIVTYLWRWIRSRDWRNIQWHNLPWRKEE